MSHTVMVSNVRMDRFANVTPADIGQALRRIIYDAGLYQADVAHTSGIPTRTFMRYLAGDSAMPLSAMFATAYAMGIEPGELAERIADYITRSGDD